MDRVAIVNHSSVQCRACLLDSVKPMALETAVDRLVQRCSAARSSGTDFPTVWNTILKKNRLVAGNPVQAMEDGKPILKVLLASNQYLVCGRDGFCVRKA